jgi:hypothetical protein
MPCRIYLRAVDRSDQSRVLGMEPPLLHAHGSLMALFRRLWHRDHSALNKGSNACAKQLQTVAAACVPSFPGRM